MVERDTGRTRPRRALLADAYAATTNRDPIGTPPTEPELRTSCTPHAFYCRVDLPATNVFVPQRADQGPTRIDQNQPDAAR
jgi:hypothetical protein